MRVCSRIEAQQALALLVSHAGGNPASVCAEHQRGVDMAELGCDVQWVCAQHQQAGRIGMTCLVGVAVADTSKEQDAAPALTDGFISCPLFSISRVQEDQVAGQLRMCLLGLGQRREPVNVQAFVAQRSIECSDETAIGWLTEAADVDFWLVVVRPEVKQLSREFAAVVDEQAFCCRTLFDNAVKSCDEVFVAQAVTDDDRQRFSAMDTDDRSQPDLRPVGQWAATKSRSRRR